jgi:hypothetical protein
VITCKQFLEELGDDLARADMERHVQKCSHCRVIWNTTRKTVQFYQGMPLCALPPDVESRLAAALEKRITARPRGSTFTVL